MSNRTLIVDYSHTDGSYSTKLQVFGNAVRDNATQTQAIRPATLSPSAV